MSALNNDYLYEILGSQGFAAGDDIALPAGSGTTQATASIVAKGQLHRVTVSIASAAILLKSVLSNDNPQIVFIINDTGNTVQVFPYKAIGAGATDTGEAMNGVANAAFSITANNAAIFVSSLVQPKRKGGSSGSTPALNWSAALLS